MPGTKAKLIHRDAHNVLVSDSPRILHAPLNIAGGPEALSAGLNAIGCESRLMVFTKQPFRDGSDINLHLRQGGGPVNLALNLPKQAWAFGRSIPDYDIFQFHFGVTIVPKRVNLPVLGRRTPSGWPRIPRPSRGFPPTSSSIA